MSEKLSIEDALKIIHRQHHELKRLSSENNSECEQLRNVCIEMEHYLAKAPKDIFGFGSAKTLDNIEYSWPIRDEWRAKLLKAISYYDERDS